MQFHLFFQRYRKYLCKNLNSGKGDAFCIKGTTKKSCVGLWRIAKKALGLVLQVDWVPFWDNFEASSFSYENEVLGILRSHRFDHGEVDSTNSLCLKKTKNNVIKFLFLKKKRDRISNWKKILPPGMPLLERHIGSWKYFRTIDGQGTCIWGCLKVTFLCRITVSVGILSKNTY